MKIRIEADSHDELREKSDALLRQLAKALSGAAPDVADALQKARVALPPKEDALKHEALRDFFQNVHKRYIDTLDRMLAEMGEALDAHVDEMKKSGPDYTTGIISMESAAYDKAKEQLAVFGFSDADFTDPSGKLYGMSTNELRELLKQLNAQKAG